MHEAARLWHDSGCDCVNVWGFEEQVDSLMEENFGDLDTDSDKQSDYKRGVRDGAELVVNEHERECLDESPDECFDLGQAAAMQVRLYYVYHYCLAYIDSVFSS